MDTINRITVKTTVEVPVQKVWEYWTEPEHIVKWLSAHPEWHTTIANNDLREGGKFLSRMESKDGKLGFDFCGTYDEVKLYERISYTIEDGRKVTIIFIGAEDSTDIIESFDAENTNPPEMQQQGWQAILDNFKKYAKKQKFIKVK